MIPTKTVREWLKWCVDNQKNLSTYRLVCLDDLKKELSLWIEPDFVNGEELFSLLFDSVDSRKKNKD